MNFTEASVNVTETFINVTETSVNVTKTSICYRKTCRMWTSPKFTKKMCYHQIYYKNLKIWKCNIFLRVLFKEVCLIIFLRRKKL